MGTVVEPRVTLLACTGWDGKTEGGTVEPLKLIASQILNMTGKMVHDTNEIDVEEAIKLVNDLKRTALAGALETIDVLFQIEDIPRSLTHQMVRTRVGATYHQESLRFTTREDGFNFDMGRTISDDIQQDCFVSAMNYAGDAYAELVKSGVSMEDARGVLPIATATKLGVKYNFKTLVHASHVRLCHQSQSHWLKIFIAMQQEIRNKIHPVLADFLQPICDLTGRCEYKGIFDRKCPKETVKRNMTCSRCMKKDSCNEFCQALKELYRIEA